MSDKHKKTLDRLYIELVKLQKEVIAKGLKLLIVIEGRDAAGKDGTIKKITKHLSPRETRIVALGKPSDKENNEWYFQRFTAHLPANGEFVIFNRSWYNRAGVEKVMGFCTEAEYEEFFEDVPLYEKLLVNAGTIILKYYLSVSKREQKKRLDDRRKDPLKQWKISPIDEKAQALWKEYSKARDVMLERASFEYAPWFIADAENKDDLHIALITHLLQQIDYNGRDEKLLDKDYGLVYPAIQDNIRTRLYK